MGHLKAILVMICVVGAGAVAAQDVYYVAPDGSDSNPGTLGLPFATIQKARDVVRTINGSMTGDIEVCFMPGRYYIDSTVSFNDTDSGTNGYDVIYKSYGVPGSAEFVGGQVITGWQVHSGQIYKADVTGLGFSTLYENGNRARKARTPNHVYDPPFPVAMGPYYLSQVGSTTDDLFYDPADFNPNGWDWDDAEVVVWSGYNSSNPGYNYDWFSDTVPINFIATASQRIYLTEDTRYTIGSNARYFVQGFLEVLDEPGEFHLDRSANTLYYWPMDGDIANDEIIAPVVQVMISVKGASQGSRVNNLVFEGLRFEYTDFAEWYRHAWPNNGDSGEGHAYPQYDRQMSMPQHRKGVVFLENTDHVTVKDCYIANAGYSGIYCFGYNQYNTFTGNALKHLGHSGIFFEGPYPGEGDVLNNNAISNTKIQYIGELVGQGGGVNLMNSGKNTLSHLDISDGPRYGILMAAYVGIPCEDIYLSGNQVEYTAIARCALDSGDMGVINNWGLCGEEPYLTNYFSQITVDYVPDNPTLTDPAPAPNGVFMDADTNGQSFSNIHVTNVTGSQFRYNHSPIHTFKNVSWEAGFNASLMEYNQIGLQAGFVFQEPSPPVEVNSAFNGVEVLLSWSAGNNAASYELYRSQTPDSGYVKIAEDITTLCFLDTDVSIAGSYYYYLKSITAAGLSSGPSKVTSVTPASAAFTDGFETGLGNWTAVRGTASRTSSVTKEGVYSYNINEDQDVITRDFGSFLNGRVVIWFYDHVAYTAGAVMARVDNDEWDTPYGKWVGLGVHTATSATHYVYRVGDRTQVTSIPRTTGWHEFIWNYTSGSDVKVYIDGQFVVQTDIGSTFRYISMGDWWPTAGGLPTSLYFDAIEVLEKVPGDWNGDGTVDVADLSLAASYWLQFYGYESAVSDECYRSSVVDMDDFSHLGLGWGY